MSRCALTDRQISRYAYLIRTTKPAYRERCIIDADLRARHALTAVEAEWRRQDDKARAAEKPIPTLREALRARIQARIARVVRGITPKVSGAGNEFVHAILDPKRTTPDLSHSTSYGNRSSVARSYGYAVIDHHQILTIAPTMRVSVIGGILTIYRRGDDTRTGCACWWTVASRGYSMRMVAGYVVRGIHLHARSLAAAQARVARDRSRQAAEAWRRRVIERNRIEVLRGVWVGREDSVAAGNCPAGTDAFVRRVWQSVGVEIGAMRADALLALAKTLGQVQYVERAINYALGARYQQAA